MEKDQYVIGLDYGTDSVRSVIINTSNGDEVSSHVHAYTRWAGGKYCEPSRNQFRQHPLDYIESLEVTVKKTMSKAPAGIKSKIKGISIDTTGSTPVAVDRKGVPLSLTPGFEENPNAMFVLWKDHTAVKEAEDINKTARTWGGTDYTKYEGGVYSSEWFWAKILHVLREDKNVREKAFSWVEHCDWITALLCGQADPLEIKRSRCAAGHKAMWHEDFNGLPPEEFLCRIDPLLKGLRDRLYRNTYTSDIKAGNLCSEWAERLGLTEDVTVGVGAFDAHMGAVGGEIRPYVLCKIMGTSTCDILVSPAAEMKGRLVKGICGQVDGSVIPGMLGLEAGQSAFGDVYAWFKNILMWPVENILKIKLKNDAKIQEYLDNEFSEAIIPQLSEAAERIDLNESGIIALDWMNGRRTPDANQALKGAIMGLNLVSDAPRIFRSLIEATAFGARKIADRFIAEGVPINEVIALGGVAKKAPFIMQFVSDILNMKIKVARSEQTCALGAAMFASVAAGIYPTIEAAQKAMGSGFEKEYHPRSENAGKYQKLYNEYSILGEFVEKQTQKEL
jgi:L-ribulokinase